MYLLLIIIVIILWISYLIISIQIASAFKNFPFFSKSHNYDILYKAFNYLFALIFYIGLLIVPIYAFDIIDWLIPTNYINDHSGLQLPFRFWRDLQLSWH